ncbi:hypothetical protein AVDCRST_MAG84-1950 [uncultured Microcoleus sp.]|uniref:Uncharacterized protein n=1 Tax=uncultured Microcoleus sp. TaxID=259945 RepID=A0A6J4LGM0_9CYAN|nr:hypothetical protein AVDCRST_MAG84-1950 [uncultured Microcoleus sp.]
MSSGFVNWRVLNEPRRRQGREGREEKEFTSSMGKVRIAHLRIRVVRRSAMSGVTLSESPAKIKELA